MDWIRLLFWSWSRRKIFHKGIIKTNVEGALANAGEWRPEMKSESVDVSEWSSRQAKERIRGGWTRRFWRVAFTNPETCDMKRTIQERATQKVAQSEQVKVLEMMGWFRQAFEAANRTESRHISLALYKSFCRHAETEFFKNIHINTLSLYLGRGLPTCEGRGVW
jgi:hypothetical protein